VQGPPIVSTTNPGLLKQPIASLPLLLSAFPVIPISFVKDGAMMSYFSLVTAVGTPQAIAAQELRVECM
jgi:hypothetical protein